MNITRTAATAALALACCLTPLRAQAQSALTLADGSGTLMLGVMAGGTDRWLDGNDSLLERKLISVSHKVTDNGRAIAVEVRNNSLPDSLRLVWLIGGCDAPEGTETIVPEHCRDNVFNVEGTQVYVYHGRVMRLRMTRAIVPPGSETRICDSRSLGSPSEALNSPKKTDSPVLCGTTSVARGQAVYVCIFKPGRSSDHTYSGLPELFTQNNSEK